MDEVSMVLILKILFGKDQEQHLIQSILTLVIQEVLAIGAQVEGWILEVLIPFD
ncbi:MAG: hypothetical protein M3162_03805 [Thermoproteota archaeon]|nr:hypothetical protein [Thermoproteota archaeon]